MKGGEICRRCKKPYYDQGIWRVSDSLWKKVTGIKNGSGLYCMKCFAKMADKIGIIVYWTGFPNKFRRF